MLLGLRTISSKRCRFLWDALPSILDTDSSSWESVETPASVLIPRHSVVGSSTRRPDCFLLWAGFASSSLAFGRAVSSRLDARKRGFMLSPIALRMNRLRFKNRAKMLAANRSRNPKELPNHSSGFRVECRRYKWFRPARTGLVDTGSQNQLFLGSGWLLVLGTSMVERSQNRG